MSSRPIISRAWWKESGAASPRWLLALGAAATIALSILSSFWMQNVGRTEDSRAQQITLLLDSIVQFQVFAANFATEINEQGSVSLETKRDLLQNLNEQFAKIKTLEPVLGTDLSDSAAEYKQAILRMIDAANVASDIGSMKAFWGAASDLLVARKRFTRDLQSSI